MSYSTISQCRIDGSFYSRVQACIAQEQANKNEPINPEGVINQMSWVVACASDVEQAYESAIAGDNPNPGGDPSVITDGMILAHVQANWVSIP